VAFELGFLVVMSDVDNSIDYGNSNWKRKGISNNEWNPNVLR